MKILRYFFSAYSDFGTPMCHADIDDDGDWVRVECIEDFIKRHKDSEIAIKLAKELGIEIED